MFKLGGPSKPLQLIGNPDGQPELREEDVLMSVPKVSMASLTDIAKNVMGLLSDAMKPVCHV